MRDWHADYAERVQPIKDAMVPVIQAFQSPEPPADVDAACRHLSELLMELLTDDSVFQTPDDSGQLGHRLKMAYQRFAKMSRACRGGYDARVRGELFHAEVELGEAAKILAPFGLEP